MSGILVVIVGIGMVQTGFAGLDDAEPTVGLYLGGIFSIIGGSLFGIIGGIVFLYFDDLKKMYSVRLARFADAIEEERNK